MSTTLEDATLGKIIFTNKAIAKMKDHGLYHYHIKDALLHGHLVKSLVEGLKQIHYRHDGEREIGVLFTDKDRDKKPLGGVLIISAWAKNLK